MKLEQKYSNPRSLIGFSGRGTISRYAKGVTGLDDKLSHIPTYVLHREVKRPRPYNPVILYEPRTLLQGDLIDMVSRGRNNKGKKYILVIVDAFTRKAWVEPLTNKSGPVVLAAFKKILKKTGKFKRFMSDAGKEFLAEGFQKLLTQHGIEYVRGHPHAPHVERLNRTLQGKLFKYMTENETNTWLGALDPIVESYNARHHRMIDMSPNEAERKENRSFLINKVTRYYEKALQKRKKPKFKVGDIVSVQKDKGNFSKGYTQVFTDELYKVFYVHTKLPIPMYTLIDYDFDMRETDPEIIEDKLVRGRFYENELQSAKYGVFKVERIVDRKVEDGKQFVLVKWKGWPARYNSWEPASNIVRRYRK